MKCFYSGAEAVGVCLACGRGLSPDHAAELERGLACRNRCEAAVQRIPPPGEAEARMAALAERLDKSARDSAVVSAGFSILAGAAFIYFMGPGGLSLPTFMGGAFIVYGFFSIVRAVRGRGDQGIKRKDAKNFKVTQRLLAEIEGQCSASSLRDLCDLASLRLMKPPTVFWIGNI